MSETVPSPDLSDRRVLIPGGTGGVAVAASASTQPGRHVRILNRAQAEDALVSLGAAQ